MNKTPSDDPTEPAPAGAMRTRRGFPIVPAAIAPAHQYQAGSDAELVARWDRTLREMRAADTNRIL